MVSMDAADRGNLLARAVSQLLRLYLDMVLPRMSR